MQPYQPIDVPLFAPLDEGSDALSVTPPAIARAENAEYPKKGAVAKRPGRRALSGLYRDPPQFAAASGVDRGPLADGSLLWQTDGKLWQAAKGKVYHHEPTIDRWLTSTPNADHDDDQVRYKPCRLDVRDGPDDANGIVAGFHASNGTHRIWAWADGTNHNFAVEDENGAELVRGVVAGVLTGGILPVAWPGGALGFFSASGTGVLAFHRVDPVLGVVQVVTLASDLSTAGGFTFSTAFDAAYVGTGVYVVFAYIESVNQDVKWGRLEQNCTFSAFTTETSAGDAKCVGVCGRSDGAFAIAWGNNAGANSIQCRSYSAAGAALHGVLNVDPAAAPGAGWAAITLAWGSQDLLYAVYSPWLTEATVPSRVGTVNTALGTVIGTQTVGWDCLVRSSPRVIANDKVACWFFVEPPSWTTEVRGQFLLIECLERTPLARAGGGRATYIGPPILAHWTSEGEVSVLLATGGKNATLAALTWGEEALCSAVATRRSTTLGGGLVLTCDGRQVYEQGFLQVPTIDASSAFNGAGSLTPSSTYPFLVTYGHVDAHGHVTISTFDTILLKALGGTDDTVTLTIRTLQFTLREDVYIQVWRGVAGAGAAGPFYLVSGTDTTAAGPNGWLRNDVTVRSVTFEDRLSDALLVTRPQLALPTVPPQAPHAAAFSLVAKGRQWRAGGGDLAERCHFTKFLAPFTAPESSDGFFFDVDAPITGLALLNDDVIAFTEERIFAVRGEGPTDAGAGSFSLPQPISVDAGCISPRSVVSMPQGVMFQSKRGICLLDQSLQVHFVGEPVLPYGTEEITAAVLVPARTQVRFLQRDRMLVFDYSLGWWAVWTIGGAHATLWQGNFAHVAGDDVVQVEDDTLYLDAGLSYARVVQTGWIFAGSAQGWQRIRRVIVRGRYGAPHLLRIEVGYDYEETWEEILWDAHLATYTPPLGDAGADLGEEQPLGAAYESQYQVRARLSRVKCEAIRFRITDVLTDEGGNVNPGTGQRGRGCDLLGLALDIALAKGAVKLGANRSR